MPEYWPHISAITVRNLNIASLEETQVTAIFKPMEKGSIQIRVDQIELLISKTTSTPPTRLDGGCLQGKKSTREEWGFGAKNGQVQTWLINSKEEKDLLQYITSPMMEMNAVLEEGAYIVKAPSGMYFKSKKGKPETIMHALFIEKEPKTNDFLAMVKTTQPKQGAWIANTLTGIDEFNFPKFAVAGHKSLMRTQLPDSDVEISTKRSCTIIIWETRGTLGVKANDTSNCTRLPLEQTVMEEQG